MALAAATEYTLGRTEGFLLPGVRLSDAKERDNEQLEKESWRASAEDIIYLGAQRLFAL